MSRRRAVSPEDAAANPDRLPMLYKSMVPLSPQRHGALRLKGKRDFQVAGGINAVPLTADEYPRAMRDFPIVFASPEAPTPVALVGFEKGKNDFVTPEGGWRQNAYVPAYLRRYPFALPKESAEGDRHILCADLSSVAFTENPDEGELLFVDGEQGPAIKRAMDFCQRYEAAAARTRSLMTHVAELGLIGPSTVSISQGEKKRKIEGFSIISEEKVRALDDKTLADLARRGVLTLFAAHQLSLANFSSFGTT